jgi:hypothetical protein
MEGWRSLSRVDDWRHQAICSFFERMSVNSLPQQEVVPRYPAANSVTGQTG